MRGRATPPHLRIYEVPPPPGTVICPVQSRTRHRSDSVMTEIDGVT